VEANAEPDRESSAEEAALGLPPLCCPNCGEQNRFYRDGFYYPKRGKPRQRWLCRSCFYRFTQPQPLADSQVKLNVPGKSLEKPNPGKNLLQANVFQSDLSFQPTAQDLTLQSRENVTSQLSSKQTIIGKALNTFSDYNRERRVGASPSEAKNSARVASTLKQTEKKRQRAAGATESDLATIKGEILTYLVHLKNNGYKEATIMQKKALLYRLLRLGADLHSPQSVKRAIAALDGSESYKLLLCIAYEGFVKYHGIQGWTRPKYKQCQKFPFVPYEEEIDALISGCGRKTATFLRLLKETAMRFGEAWRLKWTDIDFKNNIIVCNNPEKRSNPRIFRVSSELIGMLDRLKRKSVHVFGGSGKMALKVSFMEQRKRLAYKLQNPRLMRISFRSIRHWKATMLYHETKDILYVMKFLGHKSIKNTLIYIDLERACFPRADDGYHVRVAQTPEEITELIEAGFEYVLEKDGLVYFRKRK